LAYTVYCAGIAIVWLWMTPPLLSINWSVTVPPVKPLAAATVTFAVDWCVFTWAERPGPDVCTATLRIPVPLKGTLNVLLFPAGTVYVLGAASVAGAEAAALRFELVPMVVKPGLEAVTALASGPVTMPELGLMTVAALESGLTTVTPLASGFVTPVEPGLVMVTPLLSGVTATVEPGLETTPPPPENVLGTEPELGVPEVERAEVTELRSEPAALMPEAAALGSELTPLEFELAMPLGCRALKAEMAALGSAAETAALGSEPAAAAAELSVVRVELSPPEVALEAISPVPLLW